MAAKWTSVQVARQEMRAYEALPDAPGHHPAVIVIQHGAGVDDWVQAVTRRLSAAGYAAIAPDLYYQDPDPSAASTTKIGRLKDENIIKDIGAVIDYLSKNPSVRADRIGVTGFCMGGRVTYLLAATIPQLKAAGVFYGGNIMVPWGDGPTPFDRTSNIGCPIIGFFGEDDPNPSPADVAKIDAELSRHGKLHEFHSYAGTEHSFQWNGTSSYRAEASKDSWDKLLSWFQTYLRD